ncbi:MarR family winged helix-turn-helix transcriptional regulator [Leifsonia sp. 2TAF2]|uniref:MarR family winged helix-turn-helix transcriptional regulator n=1 Tax=Leifsonia sp. 2TAF2 TaxID=3233009 RepID=UPI003F9AE012
MTDGDRAEGLTGETLATWASLATLLEWLPPALDAPLLRDAGLTHFEYGILYALADAPDSTLRMSELAAYANSSLTRLSRAVARLEKRGWVLRRPDPTDGRYTLAALLDAGRDVFRAATPGHERNVQRLVFDRLTRTQQRQLGEISRQILGAIREEGGWQKR